MGSAGRRSGRGALLTVSFYFMYPDALTSGGFYMQTNQPESRLPTAFFLSSHVLGHNPPGPITKYQKTRDSPYTLVLLRLFKSAYTALAILSCGNHN